MYIETKFYITNGKNSNKKGRILRELQKQLQYVKIRTKSLVITDISTYRVKFECD